MPLISGLIAWYVTDAVLFVRQELLAKKHYDKFVVRKYFLLWRLFIQTQVAAKEYSKDQLRTKSKMAAFLEAAATGKLSRKSPLNSNQTTDSARDEMVSCPVCSKWNWIYTRALRALIIPKAKHHTPHTHCFFPPPLLLAQLSFLFIRNKEFCLVFLHLVVNWNLLLPLPSSSPLSSHSLPIAHLPSVLSLFPMCYHNLAGICACGDSDGASNVPCKSRQERNEASWRHVVKSAGNKTILVNITLQKNYETNSFDIW